MCSNDAVTHDDRPSRSRRAERPAVQPRGLDSDTVEVVGEWVPDVYLTDALREAEATDRQAAEAAERLERFMADADLLTQLQLVEFGLDTPEWREFAGMLVQYGYGVFVGWCLGGLLRIKAFAHGDRGVHGAQRLPEADKPFSRDDASEFAAELMIYSVPRFRDKTLMSPVHDRRWSAQGGTSLKSFFIGRALMDAPDTWTRLERDRRRASGAIDHREWKPDPRKPSPTSPEVNSPRTLEHLDSRRAIDPARHAVAGIQLDEIFVDDALERFMHEYRQDGYSIREITEILNQAGHAVTTAAVRTRMTRLNAKARRNRSA